MNEKSDIWVGCDIFYFPRIDEIAVGHMSGNYWHTEGKISREELIREIDGGFIFLICSMLEDYTQGILPNGMIKSTFLNGIEI